MKNKKKKKKKKVPCNSLSIPTQLISTYHFALLLPFYYNTDEGNHYRDSKFNVKPPAILCQRNLKKVFVHIYRLKVNSPDFQNYP